MNRDLILGEVCYESGKKYMERQFRFYVNLKMSIRLEMVTEWASPRKINIHFHRY